MSEDIVILILMDSVVLFWWVWVSFCGGDKKMCETTMKFWDDGSIYNYLKPIHYKIFAQIFLLGLMAGNIGVLLNKIK